MNSSGSTVSQWARDVPLSERRFRTLGMDEHADVIVVGGGIAGVTTALLLAQEKLEVMLVDDGPIGGGETERTTAHLSSAMDDGFQHLERLHSRAGARLAWESHSAAIDLIEDLVVQRQLECDFTRVDGWLFAGRGSSAEQLEHEMRAAHRVGFVDVEMHDRAPEVPFNTGLALRFPRQARIHPLRYLAGLARAFEDEGGTLHTGHHVTAVEGGPAPRVLTADGRVLHADRIVVCTNTPVNDRVAIHTKQTAWRTYVVALRLARGAFPDILLWDDEDPYHYVRLAPGAARGGDDLLIVGGEDHKTGHEANPRRRWAALESWAQDRFPRAEAVTRWSGQVIEPFDGLAFIGRNPGGPDNIFIATGDSGQGMTHGTIAAMILKDLVRGVDHPWADLYDPSRKPTRGMATYAADNLDAARQYADHVLPAPYADPAQIPRGSGGVVRRGLRPVAVVCDVNGTQTSCSAVCPHLGGMVQWNEAERTWDCPVHGSRFDSHGHVVNGPANTDLAPLPEPAEETLPLLVGREAGDTA